MFCKAVCNELVTLLQGYMSRKQQLWEPMKEGQQYGKKRYMCTRQLKYVL